MANGSDLFNVNVPIGIGSGENISVPFSGVVPLLEGSDMIVSGGGQDPMGFPQPGPREDLPRNMDELVNMVTSAVLNEANIETTPTDVKQIKDVIVAGGGTADVANAVRNVAADFLQRKQNELINLGITSATEATVPGLREVSLAARGIGKSTQLANQIVDQVDMGMKSLDEKTENLADRFEDRTILGPLTQGAEFLTGVGSNITGGFGGFTDELAQTGQLPNILYQRGQGLANKFIFDPITNRIRGVTTPVLDFIRPSDNPFRRGEGIFGTSINIPFFGRDDDREDDRPVPVVVPVVSGPAGRVVDPGDISRSFGGRGGADRGGDVVIGGGADASQPDFTPGNVVIGRTTGTTPGPAGMGFRPPAPRRRRRTPMGKAEGGLATIPRYLKGR
jgi:hypothetical protein